MGSKKAHEYHALYLSSPSLWRALAYPNLGLRTLDRRPGVARLNFRFLSKLGEDLRGIQWSFILTTGIGLGFSQFSSPQVGTHFALTNCVYDNYVK
jgi:hypothetical protein